MPFSAAWLRPGELVRGGGGGRGRGLPARREGPQLRLDGGCAPRAKALVLEVGDGADVWGPHGSEMSCGT